MIVVAFVLAIGATHPKAARSFVHLDSPVIAEFIAIFKNACFAGGVLLGLWVETNFVKENIRRYDSMASLFEAASVQFDDHFKLLKDLSLNEKEKAEQDVIGKLQSLLVTVGREAL